MAAPTLIYCAGGNICYSKIAIEHGWMYGARLPITVYHKVYFADQDWKKPDRESYMKSLALHKPVMASVLDLEKEAQYPEVMSWAEEASQHVGVVVIIPKVKGIVPRIPKRIGRSMVRLGYSVATTYGSTPVLPHEMRGRSVHLLGGSPQKQMELARYMKVDSCDGNMMQKQANTCRYWDVRPPARSKINPVIGRWIQLKDSGDHRKVDAHIECFTRSVKNIKWAWDNIFG